MSTIATGAARTAVKRHGQLRCVAARIACAHAATRASHAAGTWRHRGRRRVRSVPSVRDVGRRTIETSRTAGVAAPLASRATAMTRPSPPSLRKNGVPTRIRAGRELSRTGRVQPVSAGEFEWSVAAAAGKQGGTAGSGSSLAETPPGERHRR